MVGIGAEFAGEIPGDDVAGVAAWSAPITKFC
jgi:hypothetical protein